MKPASRTTKFLLLGSIVGFILFLLITLVNMDHNYKKLPFIGPREVVLKDGQVDTLYHTVPDFEFIDHRGKKFTSEDVKGKILVVDFFFTRCGSICPKMTTQMARLEWMLKDPAFENVMFISHTVDPEYDTPDILAEYRRHYKAGDRWVFLTGEKQAIYEQGVKGYYLSAQEDALAPGGFLHSEKFVLVDPHGRIRGTYDGTDGEEVDRLEEEIRLLMKELRDEQLVDEQG
jgi:protein SCO1/2